jgi:hypothetical protein
VSFEAYDKGFKEIKYNNIKLRRILWKNLC